MKRTTLLAVAALVLQVLAACVQMPSERHGVADMRPHISFVAEQRHRDALVYIDNAAVGRVGDYLEGTAALRILPGTHVIRVVSATQVLLEERFYVADGVSRSFVIR